VFIFGVTKEMTVYTHTKTNNNNKNNLRNALKKVCNEFIKPQKWVSGYFLCFSNWKNVYSLDFLQSNENAIKEARH
jgi:hypothetical protein